MRNPGDTPQHLYDIPPLLNIQCSQSKHHRRTVASSFRHTAANTTAHGFSQLFGTEVSLIRLFWLVCLVLCWSFFAYQIRGLWRLYDSEPVTTLTLPNGVEFNVPDITICSPSPMSSSHVKQTMTLLPDNPNLDRIMGVCTDVYELTAKIHRANSAEFNGLLINTVTQTVGLGEFSWLAGHMKHQMVVDVTSNNVPQSWKQFELVLHHEHLNCYRIRPNDSSFQSPFGVITLYLFADVQSKFRNEVGGSQALPLSLFTFKGVLVYDRSASLIIYFTQRNQYPDRSSSYIRVSAGQLTEVKLRMTEVKQQNRRMSPCLESPPDVVLYNDLTKSNVTIAPSADHCVFGKMIDWVVVNLRCYPAFMAKLYKYRRVPYCFDMSRLMAGEENITSFIQRVEQYKTFLSRIPLHMNSLIESCRAQRLCHYDIYSIDSTTSRWPLPTLYPFVTKRLREARIARLADNLTVPGWEEILNVDNPSDVLDIYIKQNLMKVEISPAESASLVLEEIFPYRFETFLSHCGGQMGLLLGISVLSLAELIGFAMEALYIILKPKNF